MIFPVCRALTVRHVVCDRFRYALAARLCMTYLFKRPGLSWDTGQIRPARRRAERGPGRCMAVARLRAAGGGTDRRGGQARGRAGAAVAAGALVGARPGGAGGAVVAVAAAAVLLAVAVACCDRLALSAMLARPVGEVEHPELYRLVRELSKAGRLPVPRLYLSPAEQPNSFAVGRGPAPPRSAAPRACSGARRGRAARRARPRARAHVRPGHPGLHVSRRGWRPSSRPRPRLARFRPARRPDCPAAQGRGPLRPRPGGRGC